MCCEACRRCKENDTLRRKKTSEPRTMPARRRPSGFGWFRLVTANSWGIVRPSPFPRLYKRMFMPFPNGYMRYTCFHGGSRRPLAALATGGTLPLPSGPRSRPDRTAAPTGMNRYKKKRRRPATGPKGYLIPPSELATITASTTAVMKA